MKKVALKINIKVSRIQCNILMTLQNEIQSYAAIPNQFFNYVIFTGLAFSQCHVTLAKFERYTFCYLNVFAPSTYIVKSNEKLCLTAIF